MFLNTVCINRYEASETASPSQDLRRSNFTSASAKGTNFKGANLQGAYFMKAGEMDTGEKQSSRPC